MTPDEAKRRQTAAALAARDRWAEQVWTSSLKPLERLVALAYADHARDGLHNVWLSVERLRERTGLSRDAAHRALRGLESAGWLRVVQAARQHRSTRYALDVPSSTTDLDPAGALDQQSVSRTPQQSVSRTAEISSSPSPDTSSPSPDTSGPSRGPDFPSYYPSHHRDGGDRERIKDEARAAGIGADVIDDVVDLALADPDTRSPAARLARDGRWREGLEKQVRESNARAAEVRRRHALHDGQWECEHGDPAGRLALTSTGQPRCAACRRMVGATARATS